MTVTLGNGQTRTLASPGKRLAARLIDIVVLWLGSGVLAVFGFGGGALMGAFGGAPGLVGMFGAFAATIMTLFILAVLYEVSLIAVRGQTLGKMVVGIHVMRSDDGAAPGWGSALGRWALPWGLGLIPLVGWIGTALTFLSLTWDPKRQGWHDKIASTVVVS